MHELVSVLQLVLCSRGMFWQAEMQLFQLRLGVSKNAGYRKED